MKTISVQRTSSKGIVIGKAYVVNKVALVPSSKAIKQEDIESEINKLEQSIIVAADQIEKLSSKSDIFLGHLLLVKDVMLKDAIVAKIRSQKNVEQALTDTIDEFVSIFESMVDEYMKERAHDIKDVGNRILRILKGVQDDLMKNIQEKVIVIANDLSPSDTAMMDFEYVIGFITEFGGVTSHISIIAKSIGIPALIGVKDILKEVGNGDQLIMDAREGTIILNPDDTTIQKYTKLIEIYQQNQQRLQENISLPGTTLDGKRVELCANVGSLREVKKLNENQVDRIGLFRTEYLYMENTQFPTEEEQYEVYKEAAERCTGEVIIRTLDIGGDKELPYYTFAKEDNPFLGCRGIRISLMLKDVFKTQLRAILRASNYGKIKIMFPMVISLEELSQAKEYLEQCKHELRKESIPYDNEIKVGMMIETPAAIINIEDFAKKADFFSIGTNDLTQYLLAVDRGNEGVSPLYNPFHPAVLRSIKKVIDAGHNNHINVGMCGELACDPKAIILLLGMGLDEFSMPVQEIPTAKDMIRNSYYREAAVLADKVLKANTIKEVMELVVPK